MEHAIYPYGSTQMVFKGPGIVASDNGREKSATLREIATRVYESRTGSPDHVLVIGGDGFMLDQIEAHADLHLPILGLNAGTRGFLLNSGSNQEIADRLARGAVNVYHQPLLLVEGVTSSGETFQAFAFNEAFVRASTQQSGRMRVAIDSTVRFDPLSGDGLMVSTAAGSTGWAMQKGAVPILIGTPQILLTGDATSSKRGRFSWAPLSSNSRVEIELLNRDKRPMYLVVDGKPRQEIRSVTIRMSHTRAIELAFFPETDLAEKLMQLHFPS
jgi:NAD+ kinase